MFTKEELILIRSSLVSLLQAYKEEFQKEQTLEIANDIETIRKLIEKVKTMYEE